MNRRESLAALSGVGGLFGSAVLSVSEANEGKEPVPFAGVYSGEMKLSDGLAPISPAYSGDHASSAWADAGPAEKIRQLVGSCMVDGDGGPYQFAYTSLHIETSSLACVYTPPPFPFPSRVASAEPYLGRFSIEGKMDAAGRIQGTVYSGSWGNIGTFDLSRGKDACLPQRTGYTGEWRGPIGGGKELLTVKLVNGIDTCKNPDYYEFDFTPGKIASFRWGKERVVTSHVIVDYLRQRVDCITKSADEIPNWRIWFNVDREGSEINGEIELITGDQKHAFKILKKT